MGHICPEAQAGGDIALLRDGDTITIDAVAHIIEVTVSDAEMAARRADWSPPPYKFTRGRLFKYIKNVQPASEGCMTDE